MLAAEASTDEILPEVLYPTASAIRPAELVISREQRELARVALGPSLTKDLARWLGDLSRGTSRPEHAEARSLFDTLESVGALTTGALPAPLPAGDGHFVGHATVFGLLVLMSVTAETAPPPKVFNVSFVGSEGPRTGGMNAIGGREIERVAPPEPKAVEPPPPAAAPPKMTLPEPKAKPKPKPRNEAVDERRASGSVRSSTTSAQAITTTPSSSLSTITTLAFSQASSATPAP